MEQPKRPPLKLTGVENKRPPLNLITDLEKKNGGLEQENGLPKLDNGFGSFQASQPSTPSVLTPKGKAEYQEQVKAFKPQEIAKEGQPKPAKKVDGGMATSFMKGLSDMNEGLFKIPRYIYNVASIPQDLAAKMLDMPQLEGNYDDVLASSGYMSPLSIIDRLGDHYKGDANQYASRQKKFDKGIVDSFIDGEYANGGKQILNNISESIPSMILMATTAGAGNASKLGYLQKTMSNALPFASQKNAQHEEGSDVPKFVHTINSTLNGLSEVIFDQSFGTQAAISKVASLFQTEGREAAVTAAKDLTKGYLFNALKKVQPLTSVAKGAAEEMTTQLAQNIVDKYTLNPNKDLMEGVLDAGVVGGAMTGAISVGGTKLASIYNSSQKKQLGELMKQRSELVDDMDNENLSDDVKEHLFLKLSKIDGKISDIDDKGGDAISALLVEDQQKVTEKHNEINAIEKSLQDENISETSKEVLADRLLKTQDELDAILTKIIDNEAQITKEAQDAESKFKDGGDQVEYEQKMKELDARAQAIKPVEETKAEEPIVSELVQEEAVVEPEMPSILEGKTDLQGGKKEPWMKTISFEQHDKNIAEQKDINEWYESNTDRFKELSLNKNKTEAEQEELNQLVLLDNVKKKRLESLGKLNTEFSLNESSINKAIEDGTIKSAIKNGKLSQKDAEKIILSVRTELPKQFINEQGINNIEITEPIQQEPAITEEAVNIEEVNEVNGDIVNEENQPEAIIAEEPIIESEGTVSEAPKETEVIPSDVSGIKKALVSDEIIASVNFDKISDSATLELGKQLLETGEIDAKNIVEDISGGNKRALQPKEVAGLIYYKATLDNQRRELLMEANMLKGASEDTGIVDAKIAKLQEDINAYDVMAVITAQQQSLAFRLRKGLLDRDYNLVTQIEQYKKTNGGYIPPEVEARFRELDQQLTDIKAKLEEAELRAKVAEENQAVKDIEEDVKRSKKRPSKSTADKALKVVQNLRKSLREKSYSDATGMVAIVDSALLTIEASIKAGISVSKAIDKGVAYIKDKLKEQGIDNWDKEGDFRKDVSDGFTTGGVEVELPKTFVKDGELVVPSAFIRDLVENGVTDIDKLSEAVKEAVETELPDITLRDARDAITKYGKTVNQTADQIQKSINEAKRLGTLYSQLEDIENGKKKTKSGKRYNELTAEERELKRKIKLLDDIIPKTDEEIAESQEQRRENRKKYLQRFIDEKKKRLAERNFNPRPKPQAVIADSEVLNLEAQANAIRNEYDASHFENEQANRTWSQKGMDEAIEWGTGASRALVAGLDFGAFGVQGAIFAASMNPMKTGLAMKHSFLSGLGTDTNPFKNPLKFFQDLGSEKYEREFLAKLRAQPYYAVMKASKLAIQEPNAKLGERDDALQASVINRIWNAAAAVVLKPLDKSNRLYERGKQLNPYRAAERAYTGAINSMRVQLFLEFAKDLDQQGITFESNPEAYKVAANTTNNLTFRGRLRFAEGISKQLAVGIFAPRKVTASLSLVNPAYWVHMGYSQPVVAKRALLKMATFITMATSVTMAIQAFRDDEEEDENPDMFNPNSSDFMKIRIGNTRINLFAGLDQNLVLFARMWNNQIKSANSTKTKILGQDAFTPTRGELMLRTLGANKQSPALRTVTNYLNQGKGRMVEWDDEIINSVTPMWQQNITELNQEHSAEMAGFLTFMSFMGMSNNTYGTAKFLDKNKDQKIIELLKSKNGAFQLKTRNNINIIVDPKTKETRNPTEEEYEQYVKDYGFIVKKKLNNKDIDYKGMTVEKFEEHLIRIKKSANEMAKNWIRNPESRKDYFEMFGK